MALLIALGAMGTAYGAWVDEIYVTGSLSTSDINKSLSCGTCWEEADDIEVDVAGTDIDCEEATSTTLTITVDDALKVTSATEPKDVDYYCTFTVSNAVNSFLPVTVASVTLTGTYTGVTADFDDLTPTVINPGTSATGQVHIYLTTDDSVETDLNYTLTVVVN